MCSLKKIKMLKKQRQVFGTDEFSKKKLLEDLFLLNIANYWSKLLML